MRVLLRKFILIPVVLSALAAVALPASASAGTKGVTPATDELWAGYFANYNNPDPNTDPMAVSGSWNVPKVSCTSNGKPITGQAAAWVGLGGDDAQFPGNNLEQIGTDSQCNKGIAHYWAWLEAPSAYTTVIRLNSTDTIPPATGEPGVDCKGKAPVSAGDNMEATVTDQGFGQFAFQIWDTTKGWYCPALWEDSNANAVPDTAEWVVEDVYALNFPQFKNVSFIGCDWTQNANTTPLFEASTITQLDIYNQSLGVTKATTSNEISPESFLVQWQHI
jgi:hypothetical protein